MDWESGQCRQLPRKPIFATALVSTLLLALFLISRLQHQSISTYFLHTTWFTTTTATATATTNTTTSQHGNNPSHAHTPFLLHPEQHVFRPATTQTHYWRVSSAFRRPDGVSKRVYVVNDAFPGPTLEARSGDRLVIYVENALDDGEGLSIHWHGLWQRHANDMDGAVGITQDPIPPGTTFTYNFTIHDEQHSSFWWHAHDGLQRADGLYGGLVVHEPLPDSGSRDLASEHLLLVHDWYHRSAQDALDFYMHPGAFGLETLPDSVLVNGVGAFACSDAVPARPLDCEQVPRNALPAIELDSQKRNILRVVNVGAYAGFSIAVANANLTPLTVDGGHRIDGRPSSSIGYLHPGERVDVLVELYQHPDSGAYLNVTLDDRPFKYQNPALTMTHSFPISQTGQSGSKSHEPGTKRSIFDLQEVKALSPVHSLAPVPDHTVVLYTLTQKLASLENEPHGFINHTVWSPQAPPLITLSRIEWNENQLVPSIPFNQSSPLWVDLVLNNLDEDSHPFHLHGHDFWVLSKYSSNLNWGSYNPFSEGEPPGGPYDLLHPVKKDTFYVPRRGYAVLRFRADNPGLWMFHCHVLWHEASGMAMAFDVREQAT